jgi:hypothetical protein
LTYVNKGQALAPWIPLATPQGWSMSLQHIDIRLPGENEHEKGNGPHLPGIGVQNKPASRKHTAPSTSALRVAAFTESTPPPSASATRCSPGGHPVDPRLVQTLVWQSSSRATV